MASTERRQKCSGLQYCSAAIASWVVLAMLLGSSSPGVVEIDGRRLQFATDLLSKFSPAGSTTNGIRQISIIGERHSGTRWLYEHIGECFNHSIPVKRHLTRYKHWFQYQNSSKYPKGTIVMGQFRHPFDWLEAMRKIPHHASNHIDLEWKEFLSKEWNTPRIGLDLEYINATSKPTCQQDFKFDEVNSCFLEPLPKKAYSKLRYSNNQPFYELKQDGSGTPFSNIMEMRAAKIRNFVRVKEYDGIVDFWPTQYEQLVVEGTDALLSRLEELTGTKRDCTASPPQSRQRRPLKREFVEYVNSHLDWSAENLVGYKPPKDLAEKEATPII